MKSSIKAVMLWSENDQSSPLEEGLPACRQGRGEAFRARGDPPENRNFRDGPLAEYAARGKPPELKTRRNNSFIDGLIFRILTGQNRPNGRGMPGREGLNGTAFGVSNHQKGEKDFTPSEVFYPDGGSGINQSKPLSGSVTTERVEGIGLPSEAGNPDGGSGMRSKNKMVLCKQNY